MASPQGDELWSEVDGYLTELFVPADPVLDAALAASESGGLPEIAVAPNQGKFLHLLARMTGARRILEIGTLGGYSTIWLARALPAAGRLITLEAIPQHAKVARANLAHAGLAEVVDVRLGPAAESLAEIASKQEGPFDFIFIDADKDNYPTYLEWSLKLSRPGTVIVADNVVRQGAIIDPEHEDPRVQGARQFNALLAADPRVDATALQTVGSKGYDGFALAVVK